ncbi:DUF4476 domain-containing protein [Phocaeicola coprocola]|uniref:DUF4476 domain-containing protein n=1 Tax=Phocaeicola coprocola TaxID=310298 RepID=UPI002FE2ECBB
MKNFMKVVIMAIVLLTTTSCGVLDASLQRSRLAESLHTGMTKREVVDLLGNPEFKRSYNGIEQWEYKKLHFISGAVTTILLDFQHDKVISFNSYAGDPPSPAYPPIAICPPAPVEEIPSLAYPTDDQAWFQELYQKVKDKPFKDERLKILREAARQSDFTCDEIVQLMKIFNFDDERLEALVILEPTIIDRENTDRIVDSMTFISGEEKAKNILNKKHHSGRLYSDGEINVLYEKVKDAFSFDQLKILQTGMNGRNITCKQCVKLLSICDFDNERIKFLQVMAPHIYDCHNRQLIIDTMSFASGKDEARQLIERYCK